MIIEIIVIHNTHDQMKFIFVNAHVAFYVIVLAFERRYVIFNHNNSQKYADKSRAANYFAAEL